MVPAISKIDFYIGCPAEYSKASFAYKMPDTSMEPIIKCNSYVFIEVNGVVKNKEIGFFRLNNTFLIRRLIYKKNNFILKSNDRKIKDIVILDSDDFQIIGKVYH